MNLTLHLVRNDLVRMRGWIACWVGVLLLPILDGVMLLASSGPQAETWSVGNRIAILTGLQGVVGYLITIVLIHEHGLVGTNQFWLTRPISGARLLGAKLVGVFLIVTFLPVVVSLPWWLWCGFSAVQVANVAGETMLVMMVIALPAALMAVLTDSFARAMLWTVVLAALVLFGILFVTIVNAAMVRSPYEFSRVIARSVVATAAVASVMASVVVIQYFVRRRGWWLGAAGALMFILLAVSMQWPWGWIPADPREWHPERASSISVGLGSAAAEPAPKPGARRPGQEVYQRIGTEFTLGGIPGEFALVSVGVRQQWRWESGANIGRVDHPWSGVSPVEAFGLKWPDDPTHATQARGSDGHRFEASAWIQPSMVARMQNDAPKFEARVWCQLLRPELPFEMPLAPSRWTVRDGRGLRIDRIERTSDGMVIVTVESRAVTIRSLLDKQSNDHSWYHRFDPSTGTSLVAIDRARGKIVDFFATDYHTPRFVIVNGVEIAWRGRSAPGRLVQRDGKSVRETVALENASLGVLTACEEALFSRTVNAERFDLSVKK